MSASFTFRPAARENVGLLIAMAGASGSGKTYSSLRLAKGLAGPGGKIAFIDTEARRGLHYADRFDFMHADMRPPFRPERFVEGIRAAEQAGAHVVILDSFSHEYDGEGGILDWAAELEAKGTKPPGNWKDPKLGHKRLMNALLQVRAHLIFCLRADEKIAIEKKEVEGSNGRTFMKTVVTPLGWMPICEKRFMFEMTASFTLTPDRPGLPNYDLPHKLQEQHRGMFPDNRPIGEDAGAALAEWARGGAPRGPASEPNRQQQQRPAGFAMLTPSAETWTADTPEKWAHACLRAIGAVGPEGVRAWARHMEAHIEAVREAGYPAQADAVLEAIGAASTPPATQPSPLDDLPPNVRTSLARLLRDIEACPDIIDLDERVMKAEAGLAQLPEAAARHVRRLIGDRRVALAEAA